MRDKLSIWSGGKLFESSYDHQEKSHSRAMDWGSILMNFINGGTLLLYLS